jgi:hypothetical protein
MTDALSSINFNYGGAKALTLLHEKHMRAFLKTWQEAKAAGLELPETSDKDYASLETLLYHGLRAARGYMVWICKSLNLSDPEIKPAPDLSVIEKEAEAYLEHVLERWRLPLVDIEEKAFNVPTYTSNWGVDYCIDAMLEHAVMHPIRHEFQLKNLLAQKNS